MRGARRERESVERALVVIASEQPVHCCLCGVFCLFNFPSCVFCYPDLPTPGASLLMNEFGLTA